MGVHYNKTHAFVVGSKYMTSANDGIWTARSLIMVYTVQWNHICGGLHCVRFAMVSTKLLYLD